MISTSIKKSQVLGEGRGVKILGSLLQQISKGGFAFPHRQLAAALPFGIWAILFSWSDYCLSSTASATAYGIEPLSSTHILFLGLGAWWLHPHLAKDPGDHNAGKVWSWSNNQWQLSDIIDMVDITFFYQYQLWWPIVIDTPLTPSYKPTSLSNIKINAMAEIIPRSDGTLNPSGVRFGSAEIYNIVEQFPEVCRH